MTTTSENLVSASDLRRITHGSYEFKIGQQHDEFMETIAERIGSSPEAIESVATYDDRLVVRSGDTFYSVQLETADNGDRYVTLCTEEPVTVYDEATVGTLVENEVESAVDAYLKGDVSGALRRISEIVSLVPSTEHGSHERAISTIECVLDRPRVWKSVMESRKDRITRFLVNQLEDLESAKLVPKFGSLYSGNLEESELSVYAEVVDTDLDYVTQRYAKLETTLAESIATAEEGAARARGKGGEVVELYEKFATDLLDDVQSVNKFVNRVLPKLTTINYRGKLRDTLVERLHRYEIAGCFVTQVAGRLAQMV